MSPADHTNSPNAAPCREGLSDALFRSPAIFGRLVAISELRDKTNGVYNHPLASVFGVPLVDWTLHCLHREIFVRWLNYNLEQQEKDLLVWLRWLGGNEEETTRLLQAIERRRYELLPAQHLEPEAALFLDDISIVLVLVRQSEVRRL